MHTQEKATTSKKYVNEATKNATAAAAELFTRNKKTMRKKHTKDTQITQYLKKLIC